MTTVRFTLTKYKIIAHNMIRVIDHLQWSSLYVRQTDTAVHRNLSVMYTKVYVL